MKILFISTMIPFPPKGGHPQRTFNLLKWTAQEHEVHLIGFAKEADETENIRQLERVCAKVYPFHLPDDWSRYHLYKNLLLNLFSPYPYTSLKYYHPTVRYLVKEVIAKEGIDILHCDMIDLAFYATEAVAQRKVVVFHNMESKLYLRRFQNETNPFKKLLFLLQSRKLDRFERYMTPRFDLAVTVSPQEKAELLAKCGTAQVAVIPNGVDTEYFTPGTEDQATNEIVFVGGLGWFPNEDGILFFLENIWPRIRHRKITATLVLVGRRGEKNRKLRSALKNGISPGIKVLGFVDDIRPIVRRASVCIVPLRIGGGTRLKIVDAMAMGKAIVSTSVGCEGLDVTHGENILIADDPNDFADHVIRLLDDSALRHTLGKAGRKLVEDRYSWNSIGREMTQVYHRLYSDVYPQTDQ